MVERGRSNRRGCSSKPDDWVRTAGISSEATFKPGFEDYEDEGNYWFANVDTLYVRYVSNDEEYGWNVGSWRQGFAKALEAYLAFESGLPISSDRGNRNDLYGLYKERLKKAVEVVPVAPVGADRKATLEG